MFEFAWWWVLLILPLPLLVRLLSKDKELTQAPIRVPFVLSQQPQVTNKLAHSRIPLVIASCAWILLVIAGARPQWLGEPISIPDEGREMMLAVDLSGSMKIEDMQVNGRQANRLSMIKSVLEDFIRRRVGDRIGLILFADTAYLQAPLTYDRDTVTQLLNETVIGLVGEQTAIGDAIGLAVKRFVAKEESNRVLILLTDGQNTAGNITPEQAKELAMAKDVTIYTIGVGADSMVVDSFFGSRRVNPSQELDERMLSDLAKSTGGQYFRARDAAELENIYQTLDLLEPISGEKRKMRPLTALFYYPLLGSIVLMFTLGLASLFLYFRQQRRFRQEQRAIN